MTDDLAHGTTVYDELTGRLGTVADTRISPGHVFLRPIGGGKEWIVRSEKVRPAKASEILADQLHRERTSTRSREAR